MQKLKMQVYLTQVEYDVVIHALKRYKRLQAGETIKVVERTIDAIETAYSFAEPVQNECTARCYCEECYCEE